MLVRLDGGGVTAWGECVADNDPYYSSETVDTAWHITAEFLAPLVLGVGFAHPREVFPALRRVRGPWYKMTVMIQSGLDITPLITHRFHFTEYEKGFDVMRSGQSGKVILNWAGD